MRRFELTLSFELPEDVTPRVDDIMDLLENTLTRASCDPAPILAKLVPKENVTEARHFRAAQMLISTQN